MNIVCEKCNTVYRFDASKIPPGGKKVKCSHCQHIFIARPESAEVALRTLEPDAEQSGELAEAEHGTEAEGLNAKRGETDAGGQRKHRLLLRQDGTRYAVADLATLQRWIVERRVTREAELSMDGEVWEKVAERMDLLPFFSIVDKSKSKKKTKREGASDGLPTAAARDRAARGVDAAHIAAEVAEEAAEGIRFDPELAAATGVTDTPAAGDGLAGPDQGASSERVGSVAGLHGASPAAAAAIDAGTLGASTSGSGTAARFIYGVAILALLVGVGVFAKNKLAGPSVGGDDEVSGMGASAPAPTFASAAGPSGAVGMPGGASGQPPVGAPESVAALPPGGVPIPADPSGAPSVQAPPTGVDAAPGAAGVANASGAPNGVATAPAGPASGPGSSPVSAPGNVGQPGNPPGGNDAALAAVSGPNATKPPEKAAPAAPAASTPKPEAVAKVEPRPAATPTPAPRVKPLEPVAVAKAPEPTTTTRTQPEGEISGGKAPLTAPGGSAGNFLKAGRDALNRARYDQAVTNLRKARDQAPNNPIVYKELAQALLNLAEENYAKQTDLRHEAVESCRKAITLNGRYAEAYHLLGVAYMQLGQKAEAARNMRMALGFGLRGDDATEARQFVQQLEGETGSR